MKKIVYLCMMAVLITVSACKTDVDSPVQFVGTELGLDQGMGSMVYVYPDLDRTIKVAFTVRSTSVNSVLVYSRVRAGEYGEPKTVLVPDNDSCVVSYTREELGLLKVSDTAFIKIVGGDVTRELQLQMISTWTNLAALREEGEAKSSITTGVTFDPIEGKTNSDTITFKAWADDWEDMAHAAWVVTYKVGSNGVVQPFNPKISKMRDSVILIRSMKDWGITSQDSLFITATVTNNGLTRVGTFSFRGKKLEKTMESRVSTNSGFRPSIKNAQSDTITMSAKVLKGHNRSWLKLKNATWSFSYNVGSIAGFHDLPKAFNITNNDTVSVAKIAGNFGALAGVQRWDTVHVTGVTHIGGLLYSLKHSFVVVQ